MVERVQVKLLLDTGSVRTLVWRELVPEGRVLVGNVEVVWCAHGERVRYPLTNVDVEVGGRRFTVQAGVSKNLPVQMLLGRDVLQLLELLVATEHSEQLESEHELVAVTIRSQSRMVTEPSVI